MKTKLLTVFVVAGLITTSLTLEARSRGDFSGGRGDLGRGRGDLGAQGFAGDSRGPGRPGELGGPGDRAQTYKESVNDDYYDDTYYVDRNVYAPYLGSQSGCVRVICDRTGVNCTQVNICDINSPY